MDIEEDEVDCYDEADESSEMIPVKRLTPEEYDCEDGKNNQCYSFLKDLELHEREMTTVTVEAVTIGRNLTEIFKQRNPPRDQNHYIKRGI